MDDKHQQFIKLIRVLYLIYRMTDDPKEKERIYDYIIRVYKHMCEIDN